MVVFHFHHEFMPNGYVGVDVFFVVSGYLITSQLLRPGWTCATFLWRRWARLGPALLLLVTVVTAVAVVQHDSLWPSVAAATYVYTPALLLGMPENTYLAPTWSLAVEMQFYVLWAIVMIRLRTVRRTRLLTLVALLALTSLVAKVGLFVLTHDDALPYFATPTRLYAVLIGCLLAIWPVGSALLARTTPLFLAATAYFAAGLPWPAGALVGSATATVMAAGLVGLCSAYPHGRAVRVLERAPFRYLGTRSYSLYLWHVLVLSSVKFHTPVPSMAMPFVQLSATFLVAEASFRFIESPARRWLYRWTPFGQDGRIQAVR